MTRHPATLCTLLTLCTVLAACGDVVYADDIQPIWTASCANSLCHDGEVDDPDLGEELNLSAGVSYGALVGVAAAQVPDLNLVEPGDADASYLWHKLNNTHEQVGGEGGCMPYLLCTSLTQKQLDSIESWIVAGALEAPQ